MKACVAIGLVMLASCTPPVEPPASFEPFVLADGEARELTLSLAEGGEAVLELQAEAPDTAWRTSERESLVLAITVNGRVRRHVVWTSPQATSRGVLVGRLEQGEHTVKLERVTKLSRDRQGEFRVTAASLKLHPDQEVARYAPIVMGRDDSATTDLPVLLLAHRTSTSIRYTVVFTNEDGGTGVDPKRLVAQWARLHDLETATTAEVNVEPVRHTFQDPFHGTRAFAGPYEGDHPVVRIATTNGLFMDDGAPAQFRFGEPPIVVTAEGEPRERVLDSYPWSHLLAEDEGVREGKVDLTCTDADKVWALDCYAYVDVVTATDATSPVWGLEARSASGQKFRSEAGLGLAGRLARSGSIRVAIPVGRGVDVQEIWAYAVNDSGAPFQVQVGSPSLFVWRNAQMEELNCEGASATVSSDVPEALLCAR